MEPPKKMLEGSLRSEKKFKSAQRESSSNPFAFSFSFACKHLSMYNLQLSTVSTTYNTLFVWPHTYVASSFAGH